MGCGQGFADPLTETVAWSGVILSKLREDGMLKRVQHDSLRHSELDSESRLIEQRMLKQVQHDPLRHSELDSESNLKDMGCCDKLSTTLYVIPSRPGGIGILPNNPPRFVKTTLAPRYAPPFAGEGRGRGWVVVVNRHTSYKSRSRADIPNLIRNPTLRHRMLKRVQHDGLCHSILPGTVDGY